MLLSMRLFSYSIAKGVCIDASDQERILQVHGNGKAFGLHTYILTIVVSVSLTVYAVQLLLLVTF